MTWIIAIGVGVAGFGVLFYAFLIGRFKLQITRTTVNVSSLTPTFAELSIVLLSDLHLGFFYSPRQFQQVVDLVQIEKPDLVLFAGDLVDAVSSIKKMAPFRSLLQGIEAPLGKFAVLGNHDYRAGKDAVVRELREAGFHVLINEHMEIIRDGAVIQIVGLDDILQGRPDLVQAMEGIDANQETVCRILLVHEPDFADRIKAVAVDLQFSGHSHGGQVCLPFIGPLLTTTLGKKYCSGLYKVRQTTVYTSRGLGTTHLPVRLGCRPELAIVTVKGGLG